MLLSGRPLVGGLMMVGGVAAMWFPLFFGRFRRTRVPR